MSKSVMVPPPSVVTFLVSDCCSENTPVMVVLPNCNSVFTPNKLCAPGIKVLLSGMLTLPTSMDLMISSSVGVNSSFT